MINEKYMTLRLKAVIRGVAHYGNKDYPKVQVSIPFEGEAPELIRVQCLDETRWG